MLSCSQISSLCTFRYGWFSAHQQQEQQPVWKEGAALSMMSDNEKINHLQERASPLRLSLEEEELQWSIKRTLESTGGSALSVLRGRRLGKRYFSIQAMQQKSPETRQPLKRRVERNQYHYWQRKSMCAERASQWMEPDGFSLRSRGVAL